MHIEGTVTHEEKLLAPLYIEGKPYSTVIVRESVGTDAESVSVGMFKKFPVDAITKLVCLCIDSVPGASRLPTEAEINDLPLPAKENILARISVLSCGDEYEIKTECPDTDCKEPFCDIISKEETLFHTEADIKAQVNITLPRGIIRNGARVKDVIARIINSNTQSSVLKETSSASSTIGKGNTVLLQDCIISIGGVKPTLEEIQNMVSMDRKKILDAVASEAKNMYAITCSKCGRKYKEGINVMDFLS